MAYGHASRQFVCTLSRPSDSTTCHISSLECAAVSETEMEAKTLEEMQDDRKLQWMAAHASVMTANVEMDRSLRVHP